MRCWWVSRMGGERASTSVFKGISGSVSGTLDAEPSSFSAVLSLSDVPGHHTEAFLAELSRVLLPGGTLQLQEPVARRKASQDESKVSGCYPPPNPKC